MNGFPMEERLQQREMWFKETRMPDTWLREYQRDLREDHVTYEILSLWAVRSLTRAIWWCRCLQVLCYWSHQKGYMNILSISKDISINRGKILWRVNLVLFLYAPELNRRIELNFSMIYYRSSLFQVFFFFFTHFLSTFFFCLKWS